MNSNSKTRLDTQGFELRASLPISKDTSRFCIVVFPMGNHGADATQTPSSYLKSLGIRKSKGNLVEFSETHNQFTSINKPSEFAWVTFRGSAHSSPLASDYWSNWTHILTL